MMDSQGSGRSTSLLCGLELARELWTVWDRQCCKTIDVNTLGESLNSKNTVTLREVEPGTWTATIGDRHSGSGASREEAVARLLEALSLTGIPEHRQKHATSLAAMLLKPKELPTLREHFEIAHEKGSTMVFTDYLNGIVRIHNDLRNELDSARKRLGSFGLPKDDAEHIDAIAGLCERNPIFREKLVRRLFGTGGER